jgi:SAM-dependent MidA family methyltransferase
VASPAPSNSTPLADLLAARIRAYGPMPFADYMRECLYHPVHGYYSRPASAGRVDAERLVDFYTNPDVHPIFGRLLARQFREMWERLERPELFSLVEVGAGTGSLANEILDFAESALPQFYSRLRYVAVERSANRRAAAEASLARHLESSRAVIAAEVPAEIAAGCVLSNELLDALAVHRVVVEEGALREIHVDWGQNGFVERRMPVSTCAITEYFAAQGVSLAEGQQAEAGLEACDWIREIGRRLGRGFVVTVDYGHQAPELYNERHMRGTLLAYQKHRASEAFYAAPGEQDLTAHVNFTALDLWGRRAELARIGLVSQSHFLMALGRGNDFADLYDPGQSEAERVRARLLFKTLIFPEGMGETFHVMIQGKGVSAVPLTGLQPL